MVWLGRGLAGCFALLASATGAQAVEWRYCYALTREDHRFHMSEPFPTTQPMEVIEAEFRRHLVQMRIDGASSACSRNPDREALREFMQAAAAYNRAQGNRVVTLDWPGVDPVVAVR